MAQSAALPIPVQPASAHTPRPPALVRGGRTRDVQRVAWDDHHDYLHENWWPGQHCAIITTTDGGKSHLIRHGLLPLWLEARVIVIDPTEDDVNYGGRLFKRVPTMPTRMQRINTTPEWYRVVPPLDVSGREPVRRVLALAYAEGNWVVVVDEKRQVTDAVAPAYGLRAYDEQLMLRARKKGVTVISATQAPTFVPSSMYQQASHTYVGRIDDVRARQRLSEISGAERKEILDAIDQLGHQEFLYVGKRHRRLEVVKAPR